MMGGEEGVVRGHRSIELGGNGGGLTPVGRQRRALRERDDALQNRQPLAQAVGPQQIVFGVHDARRERGVDRFASPHTADESRRLSAASIAESSSSSALTNSYRATYCACVHDARGSGRTSSGAEMAAPDARSTTV